MGLKDLTNLEIKDIKNLDFSDFIDTQKIKEFVAEKPNLIISILIVVVTLITLVVTINKQRARSVRLNNEVVLLRERLEVFEKSLLIQKEYNDTVEQFPSYISSDKLIKKFSELAVNYNTQILSFSPTREKIDNLTKLTSINVNITSSEYRDLVRFMHAIENDPLFIRIEKWTGSMGSRSRSRGSQENEEDSIIAKLEIGSMELKQ
jgi:Tfp pilus assembly protein PilO